MNVARFTPERLRALATMADRGMVSSISSALRQAADDAEAAERYRWLRQQNATPFGQGENFAVVIDDEEGGVWVGTDLDTAIDQAMGAQS